MDTKITKGINLDKFIIDEHIIKYKDEIKELFPPNKHGNITKLASTKIMKKYKAISNDDEIMIPTETSGEQAINLCNNLFTYAKRQFGIVLVDNKPYFRAKDIADFLEYTNTMKAIRDHVKDKYKIKLDDLLKQNSKQNDSFCLNRNEKNIVYITEAGVYSLILRSKKEGADAFQDFIVDILLPKLRQTGTVTINSKITYDTSFRQSFYDTNNIADYIDLNVTYIGIIGLHNGGILAKYGMSSRVFERDYNEHKKTFGSQFKIVHVEHTDNNIIVEDMFKKTIQTKNLNIELEFNGKNQKELFLTSDTFTIDDAIQCMHNIANNNQIKAVKDRDDKIKELTYQNDKYIIVEKEKTEQEKERTKQAEYEFKKVEVAEKENTERERIKLEIEREKTKRMELEYNNQMESDDDNTELEKNIYLQFLDENTETDDYKNIHCSTLYEIFKSWYETKNPNTEIPTKKEFMNGIKTFKKIQNVRVNQNVLRGIQHLRIKI